jgi:sigma-B regulation protein RsbU (phosphoserine phosphatase)
LRWASFGQAPLLLYRARDRSIEPLETHHPPLGILPDLLGYQPTETLLEPGDTFFVLSDGFTETMNAAQDLIGEEPIMNCLRDVAREPPEQVFTALWALVEAHAGGVPQNDDRTFLMVRRDLDDAWG